MGLMEEAGLQSSQGGRAVGTQQGTQEGHAPEPRVLGPGFRAHLGGPAQGHQGPAVGSPWFLRFLLNPPTLPDSGPSSATLAGPGAPTQPDSWRQTPMHSFPIKGHRHFQSYTQQVVGQCSRPHEATRAVPSPTSAALGPI